MLRKVHIAAFFTKDLTWYFPSSKKELFLTFDDGPTPEITEWVLSVLKEFNAKASFFCKGENAEKYPGLLSKIISEGHSIGNHSYSHLKGWKTRNKDYLQDVKKASEFINSNLFRPPYGRIKLSQIRQLKKEFRIIMWDVLPQDYNEKVSREKCLKKVLKTAKPGSIIIFHDTKKAERNLKYVLPKVLKHYSSKGFQFRSIEYSQISSLK